MPATTLGQLASRLSTYVTPDGPTFPDALMQVLERLYSKGLWQDTTEEVVLEVQDDYTIALPANAANILLVLVDSSDGRASSPSAPVRPLWHDYRLFGRSSTGMSGSVGLTDAGFSVGRSYLDAEAAGYRVRFETETGSNFSGTEKFTIDYTDGDGVRATQELNPSGVAFILSTETDIAVIHSIIWSGVDQRVRVELTNSDSDLDDAEFGLLSTPDGVLRTRRYRQSIAAPGQNLRVLFKRKVPYLSKDNDIVDIGNLNALKHGLLAIIQEDGGDGERAQYHWEESIRALNEELGEDHTGTEFTINLQIGGFGQDPIPSIL